MSFESNLDSALKRGYVAAVRFLGDRDAARDACQEAASRALAARTGYDPTREFYPWFYQILRNYCFDVLGRRSRLLFKEEVESVSPESLEERYIESEDERRVVEAIAALEPDLREVIELRHFQDLSYREMAEIVGCPEGTVMSRLYRARKALRQLLVTAESPRPAPTNANSPKGRR